MTFDFNDLISRARDTSLDDEQRYGAVMQISAAHYRLRARALDHAVERPGRPRLDEVTVPLRPQPQPSAKHQGKPQGVPTIRAFLIEQLQIVHHRDIDDRPIGVSYDQIEKRLLETFPVIPFGRFKGRPPSTDRKNLHTLAADLRKNGLVLPHRPRGERSAFGHRHGRSRVRGTMTAVEAADVLHTHVCAICDRPFTPASVGTDRGVRKPALYCRPACKQEAYRRREAAA